MFKQTIFMKNKSLEKHKKGERCKKETTENIENTKLVVQGSSKRKNINTAITRHLIVH